MFEYGEKHPILFEIILFIVAMIGAGIFVLLGSILGLPTNLSSSAGRIIVGIILFFIFRRVFKDNNGLFNNFVIILPALLFVIWNIFYNLSSGNSFGTANTFMEALIIAAAPAIFEEVIFRGIFIYNLKKYGYDDIKCLLISALVFSLVHLTNAVGGNLIAVVLQIGYSFVIGLVLGAIYLKNNSILQVILIHFLIDYSNSIYNGTVANSSYVQIAIFVLLLIGEAFYAYKLINAKE